MPALDGVRAVAVMAVLLYHAGLSVWGGFLGVETFFTLSGFLITALLLAEWQQHQQINVPLFWIRRARRLLPALFLLLIGVTILGQVLIPTEMETARGDTLAALGYIMNWHLIVSGQSYFDPMLRPPLLQHLWSLAIEEQFYLLWPLMFMLGMRYLRRFGFLAIILVAAVASSVLMAALYQPGSDPSRVYYGTDTRASALLIGAALALVWSPWRKPVSTRRGVGVAFDGMGLLALGGLLYAYGNLFEYDPRLYRGGFAFVTVATALVIMAATHPRARLLPALLGMRLLRWIGERSYGIYLWYWPIFMLTRPYVDVSFDGWQLLLLRFGSVLIIAELSYRFVEMPIRRGALGVVWQRARTAIAQYSSATVRSSVPAYQRVSFSGGNWSSPLAASMETAPQPEPPVRRKTHTRRAKHATGKRRRFRQRA